MPTNIARTLSIIRDHALRIIKVRLDRGPLATLERLIEFNHMRAAYVAQTSLYGYLKTRMGKKYVELFQDETFVAGINKAKWAVFASCLSDLTIFSSALIYSGDRRDRDATADLAIHCFRLAVEQTFESEEMERVGRPAIEVFQSRARLTDWHDAGQGENAFGRSPRDLVAHAPVVDEFKELDMEIVTNSMRFRWRDVRAQLRRRIDAARLAEDWRGSQAPPDS